MTFITSANLDDVLRARAIRVETRDGPRQFPLPESSAIVCVDPPGLAVQHAHVENWPDLAPNGLVKVVRATSELPLRQKPCSDNFEGEYYAHLYRLNQEAPELFDMLVAKLEGGPVVIADSTDGRMHLADQGTVRSQRRLLFSYLQRGYADRAEFLAEAVRTSGISEKISEGLAAMLRDPGIEKTGYLTGFQKRK